ncbi:protein mono-ADP-ribosyltransferase PARP11-like [Leptinotarsa decemlineata]|uniref:protein mono-ADP-ribosyltransferase PARP11-like n=1 Tax=Leptinotarsa decemlineata TaxID=7539 RepID=UPI003D30C1BE
MGLGQSKSEVERERQLKYENDQRRARLLRLVYEREQEKAYIEACRQLQLRKLNERENELCRGIQSLSLKDDEKKEICIRKLSKNHLMIQNLLQSIGCESWMNKVNDMAYKLETLDNLSEFQNQKRHFMQTNKRCFKLTSIQKVYNPYLLLQYKLKEQECRSKVRPVQTQMLFHGTKKGNIEGICENNFDWRLSGSSTGHKFGKGVSFSPFSNYATHYGDKSFEKIMFVAKVQVGQCCLGDGNSEIPDGSADTTMNQKGTVYVKYEDNSYYPAYVIHYEGFDPQKINRKYNRTMY